jgi:hypothetical protein
MPPGHEALTAFQKADAPRERSEESDLFAVLGRRVTHTVELAAKEAQLATLSALMMLMLVMIGAAAIVVGWALVVATAISALVTAGLSWQTAALIFAVVHGAVAAVCWRFVVQLSRNLTLPVLRSTLGRRTDR